MIKGEPFEIKLEEERDYEVGVGVVRRKQGAIKV